MKTQLAKTSVYHFSGNIGKPTFLYLCFRDGHQSMPTSQRKSPHVGLWRETSRLILPLHALGKLFSCSTMAILDAGDSNILSTNVVLE